MTRTLDSYDQMPYPGQPSPSCHLERLYTLGRLFGLDPAPMGNCRTLELGCSDGANLLPMAMAFPESRFVGLDLSRVQVEMGRANIDLLGVPNMTLLHTGIEDLDPGAGEFDYIICHGVYSWVPAVIQDRIMAALSRHLAPHGVGYVSYNTYPGWAGPDTLRALMQFHTDGIEDPRQCMGQAMAIVDFLDHFISTEDEAYAGFIKKEIEILKDIPCKPTGAAYLFHEYLEDENRPMYFHEFVRRAQGYGLQYLSESVYANMSTHGLPDEVREAMAGVGDVIRVEQYMDFLRNRRFRQTLLCRAEREVQREVRPEQARDHLLLCTRKVTAELIAMAPGAPISRAALTVLMEHRPKALPFDQLLALARDRLTGEGPDAAGADAGPDALSRDLLYYFSLNMIHFRTWQPELTLEPGDCPKLLRIARHQAGQGQPWLTTGYHEPLILPQPLPMLAGLADGRRNREALANDFKSLLIAAGVGMIKCDEGEPRAVRDLDGKALGRLVDRMLRDLARFGFMEA